MGLDCDLSMKAALAADEVRKELTTHFHLEIVENTFLVGPAIWLNPGPPEPGWKRMISEGFHFVPSFSMFIRLNPSDPAYEPGFRLMLRITQFLLERDGGDAVLLLNGEHIILQRLHGELLLNADYGNWTDGFRFLDEIRLPHKLRALPSPYL